jgi:hypothetical protein
MDRPTIRLSDLGKHPAFDNRPAQEKRTNVRLSMQEDFDLVSWLKAFQAQPGDTIDSLTVAAKTALKNDRINRNHIQTRLIEFDIKLPKKVNEYSAAARLARLESVLQTAIREQITVCTGLGIAVHPDLMAFATENL